MGWLSEWILPGAIIWAVCVLFFMCGYKVGRAFEAFKRDN